MNKMNKMIHALLMLLPVTSIASEINNTTITRLMMDSVYGSKVFIQVEGSAYRDSGHCHINSTWDYVISTNDEFGKQIHSQLLMAYAAKKQIKIIGSDLCIVNGNLEGLRRLEMY